MKPVPDIQTTPPKLVQDYFKSEFYNPMAIGTQALVPVKLPTGEDYTFTSGAPLAGFQDYLRSIGEMPVGIIKEVKPLGANEEPSKVPLQKPGVIQENMEPATPKPPGRPLSDPEQLFQIPPTTGGELPIEQPGRPRPIRQPFGGLGSYQQGFFQPFGSFGGFSPYSQSFGGFSPYSQGFGGFSPFFGGFSPFFGGFSPYQQSFNTFNPFGPIQQGATGQQQKTMGQQPTPLQQQQVSQQYNYGGRGFGMTPGSYGIF